MTRGSKVAGAMAASLAAGPLFLMSLALAVWAGREPEPLIVPPIAHWLGGGEVLVLALAVPFGFALSVFPNLIGSWLCWQHRRGECRD